ncbi:heavy metal translocating P-type ATPase [Fodinibius sediminis]|uniref:Cu2+-exporting ATPase n=1 Tax=Fodinibius sediminis TaxID=1214077 RepID=A0A521EZW3_9BACT|nr:cation-translocating P-type ATPase [Fodinibius sediminis]SMO88991.1 Cu2+-exporting ATPase [Fodinibius sediminis]
MSTHKCSLCELETPDPPVTSGDVDGVFCCSGCLHVYRLLQDMDEEQARELRRRTIEQRRAEQPAAPLPETYEEAFFKIDGMHCATCESFVETLAARQEGLYRCEASYASEMMKVYYDPDRLSPGRIPSLLSKMGYTVYDIDEDVTEENLNETARLIIGGFFGIMGLLLYVLFLYPSYISGQSFIPLTSLEKMFFVSNIFVMTTFVLAYTGFPILRGAWVSISVGRPNMDLLITIAAVSAYLYSTGAMLTGSSEVYFDVTMAIILIVSIGNYYEKKIKSGKETLLSKFSKKKINHAWTRRNGQLVNVPVSELRPGDHVVVKAGERIPVDGTVIEGEGVVNEALMTGESVPVSKQKGDRVLSGTILNQHSLTIETGETVQSTLDELMRLMWNIQSSRPGKQRLADRIAAYFVPGVIVLGAGSFGYHLMTGTPATDAMLAALAVLIVSCPCALGLATPLAIASGIRSGLENDIIFKTAALFEEKGKADIVAFDKTGTLTTGNMHLLDPGSHQQAREYAALLEQYSAHPVGEPIAALSPGPGDHRVEHFQSSSTGIRGTIDGRSVWVGQPEWLQEHQFDLPGSFSEKIRTSRSNGQVPVAVGWDGTIQSIMVVGDQLRNDALPVIESLRKEGKKIALITGDSTPAAQGIKEKLRPDFLFTEARPESKSNIIKELRKFGSVAMIGDGSNDAPALAEADLSLAFGDLTAIAAESAQIVIPNDRLELIPKAFRAIRLTRNRIRQNLGWAFLYNIITIPLAIAGTINPLFAAVAMATSSILVVSNSSRSMRLSGR